MSAREIALRTPAKLNLTLAVGARGADGYHELDSLFLGFGLEDVLVVERRAAGCSLELHGPAAAGVPADDSNLALRAAREVLALAAARGLATPGLHLRLEKHIPAAAGLGGGSSDAAAAAQASARLLGLAPEDPELRAAVARLGSDCAFFLEAQATGLARCTGRGERVEVLPAVSWPWSLLVVTPDFDCPTAAVYRALDAQRAVRPAPSRSASAGRFSQLNELSGLSLEELRRRLSNDLEPAAFEVEPRLVEFRASLEQSAPGAFRLAGSGSSWFGFFPDDASARAVLARIEGGHEGRRYALRARWLGPARSRGSRPR